MAEKQYDPSAFITQCGKLDSMGKPGHQQDACDSIEFVISRTALTPLFSFEQVWHVECSKRGVAHQESQTGTVLRLTSADISKSTISIEDMLYEHSLMIPTACRQDHKHSETKWKIRSLPDVLSIQLPRLTRDSKNNLVRNDQWFTFSYHPLILPLADSNEAEHRTASYNLCAVVSHYGTAQAGHYITYVRRDLDSDVTWFEIDDNAFHPVSFDKVNTNNAYLLLYDKIPTPNLEPFPMSHKTSSQLVPSAKSAGPQTISAHDIKCDEDNKHACTQQAEENQPSSPLARYWLKIIADIKRDAQDEEDEEEEHVS